MSIGRAPPEVYREGASRGREGGRLQRSGGRAPPEVGREGASRVQRFVESAPPEVCREGAPRGPSVCQEGFARGLSGGRLQMNDGRAPQEVCQVR